jgi:ADP-ribosyl-[dinitrogen reductase] hydrolase
MTIEQVKGALFGVAIGDALGVPAEFKTRKFMEGKPVVDFEGFKTHNQPAGTFSDDASLTFCLAESLCYGYDLQDISERFVRWQQHGYWGAHGKVFDIGNTTYRAIGRLKKGMQPELAGDFEEENNGNGSLMRILPLLFYSKDLEIEERYKVVKEVSSITHGHIRSVIACFYYLELALHLMNGKNKNDAYLQTATTTKAFLQEKGISQTEIELYAPVIDEDIMNYPAEKIFSSGYVLHTLIASVWSFMTTDNFKDATLRAVNLGNDTDTAGAITGGLAGLYYRIENIPEKWKKEIARTDEIDDLAQRLYNMRSKN